MSHRNHRLQELRDQLRKVMREHLESVTAQMFGGLNDEEKRRHDDGLNRLRDVAADIVYTLKAKARRANG